MDIAIDTETTLIGKPDHTPKMICTSIYNEEFGGAVLSHTDKLLEDLLKDVFTDPTNNIIMHYAAFDCNVLCKAYPRLTPLIIDCYEQGRILCTLLYAKLLHLEDTGILWKSYGLDKLTSHYLGVDISAEKNDANSWRLRYTELAGLKAEEYPAEAYAYALDDPRLTYKVYRKLRHIYNNRMFADMKYQVMSDFFLYKMADNGMYLDMKRVESYNNTLKDNIDKYDSLLKREKVLVRKFKTKEPDVFVRKNAKVESILKNLSSHHKITPIYTPKGKKLATSEEALSLFEGKSEVIDALLTIGKDSKEYTTFAKFMVESNGKVNASFNALVGTGRTSCFNPNLQNLPRREGVRECFVPREGHIFCAIDYSTIELLTLSFVQTKVIPDSPLMMFKSIKEGKDLHLVTASNLMGISYEEILKRYLEEDKECKMYRNMAKAMNFGLPGGLGADTFVDYAKTGYGVDIEQDRAQDIKNVWFETYPEMSQYFSHIADCEDPKNQGMYRIEQLGTDRVRAGASYCAACNTYFQGLAADGLKRAIINIGKALLFNTKEELKGVLPVCEIHDEIIFEIPYTGDRKALTNTVFALQEIMQNSMNEVIPGMPVKTEATLMTRWSKAAKSKIDEEGLLTIYKA